MNSFGQIDPQFGGMGNISPEMLYSPGLEYWGVSGMARPLPFLFCRYNFFVADEPLGYSAQVRALQELQGKYFARTARAERESHLDSIVMRPRETQLGQEKAIVWSVGRRVGERQGFEYDEKADKIDPVTFDDGTIIFTDFIALPRLEVIAVDDRSAPHHLGGRPAINRFRSIFRNIEDGDVEIDLTINPQDVQHALKAWGLTEFAFVIRPFNPHPPGDLSKRLSEEMEKDGIGRYRAKVQPKLGKKMKPADDGPIAAVKELADAGYGQYSLKGVTDEGHTAQIKQPTFEDTKEKNERRQAQPRELRVIIDADEDLQDDDVIREVIKALRGFYDREA